MSEALAPPIARAGDRLVVAVVVAAVFLTDLWLTPLGIAHGLLYAFALVPAVRSGDERTVLATGAISTALVLAALPLASVASPWPHVLVNRALTIAVLGTLTVFCHAALRSRRLHESFVDALGALGIGAARFDRRGRRLDANGAFADLLGPLAECPPERLPVPAAPDGVAVTELGSDAGNRPVRLYRMPGGLFGVGTGATVVAVPLPSIDAQGAEELLDSIREGIVAVDHDGRVRYRNARARQVYAARGGLEPGSDLLAASTPAQEALFREHFERARAGGRPVEFEAHLAGVGLDVVVRAFPRADGFTLLVRDVTAERVSERRLQAVRAQLSEQVRLLGSIVEEVGDGLFVVDGEGRPLLLNDVARELLGADVASVPPSCWAAHYDVREIDGTLLASDDLPVARALRGEVVRRRPLRMRSPLASGTPVELEATGVPIRRGDAEVEGAVVFLHDVTALRTAERRREEADAALREAQRIEAIGQLTGGIAHDFNNLLTVILGGGRMVLDELPEGGASRSMQEMIVDAAEQAAEVCRRLLAVARRQPLDPEPLALGPWAAGLQRLLQRTLGEHVDVRIPQAPALRNALVDRAELERAVLNLAVNARDAMPSGGTLWLEVGPARASDVEVGEDAQDYLTLTIRDTGAGIDEATRARLFEPFFSTKPAGKGTGLGLAQVHGFVRQSGGLVHVDSAPGAGTSVRLVLPTTELEPTERPGRTPVPAESRAGSVLLVEDEGTVRLFVETVLQRAGYTVLAVDRGADARRLLEGDRSFDLLVTDVVLPDDGGPALLAEARRLRPGLPALMISGYAEFGDGGRLPARLLRKPFDARRLCEEVDRVLSRSAVRSA